MASVDAHLARESNLTEERTLLDQARADIMRGDPSAALADLNQHETRFSKGELVEEREALVIRALARLNRGEEARLRAVRFKQRFPQSLLGDGVDSDVRSIP